MYAKDKATKLIAYLLILLILLIVVIDPDLPLRSYSVLINTNQSNNH